MEERVTLFDFLSLSGKIPVRKIEKLIKGRHVSVDGEIIDDPSFLVAPSSEIKLDDIIVPYRPLFVIALNKPSGYLSSRKDERYPSLLHLLPDEIRDEAIMSGRLDQATEGIILLSNDGRLTNALALPENKIEKEYELVLDKELMDEDMKNILEVGTDFDGVLSKPISLKNTDDKLTYRIVLDEGKYHEVIRIFRRRGYIVTKLKRIRFGNIVLGDTKIGEFKYLSKEKIDSLYKAVNLSKSRKKDK